MGASKQMLLQQLEQGSKADVSTENVFVKHIVRWFYETYTDPCETLPWEDGDYVWLDGGPYYADIVIEDKYGQFSDLIRPDIDRSIALITDAGGNIWALREYGE